MIAGQQYVRFLDQEYLRGYVDRGGAAVKFVVPQDDESTGEFVRALGAAATAAGYRCASASSAETRVQLVEEVFFEVARQIDWDDLADVATRRAVAEAGYPAPFGEPLSLDQLAVHHRVDRRELKRDLDRQLQQQVQQDYAMVQEFRTAMLRLCQACLQSGQVGSAEHAAVLDWLHGDLRQISALRSTLIFRRIGRHNARHLLFSLAHWLAVNDRAGLTLFLDLRRLAVARRPRADEREGHYYNRGALLDAYEMLRQLVDSTDEMANLMVVVVAAPAFLAEPTRGLDAYQALKLRIFDEIRDPNRDNPFSSLVRLSAP